MKQLILFFCCSILLLACGKEGTDTGNDTTKAKTILNVAYGSDAKQNMDVYLPANRTTASTKLIILVHGGGWTEGDKADFNPYVLLLQQKFPNHAIININYRLNSGSNNRFPAQENDVKAALEFINTKRNEYFISDKWAILGASAGGHLALLQAYKYASPVKLKAVISFFGPTDLVDAYYNPVNPLVPLLLQNITGTTPQINSIVYEQSSPITFVNAQSCATLLLHGAKDPLVPLSQSQLLQVKLQAFAVPNQLVVYPNGGHGWDGADLIDSFSKIENFLTQYLN